MNTKMYEVNWHSIEDTFSHCTVTPITVTRKGILPGCTGVTISATDHKGQKFNGSPDDYYNTEAEAWDDINRTIKESIESNEANIIKMQRQTNALCKYLIKEK